MKNIHVLPTDKPSRLAYYQESTSYNKPTLQIVQFESSDYKYQNIYITSDEEIKQGDWMIRGNEQPTLVTPNFFWDFGVRYYKIILTTDQDLVKNGVQSIDDEFLEWFVKNPSCELVEVDLFPKNSNKLYKIIIPQEEPKQETLEEAANIDSKNHYKNQSDYWAIGFDSFKRGAKWQAERMYNEEDLKSAFFNGGNMKDLEEFNYWFEQFKKK